MKSGPCIWALGWVEHKVWKSLKRQTTFKKGGLSFYRSKSDLCLALSASQSVRLCSRWDLIDWLTSHCLALSDRHWSLNVAWIVGFVKIDTWISLISNIWICQSCYMYFSPFAKQTKLKFEQDFKACWSFFFELKVLNEAKAMFTSQIMISEMVKSLFVVIATQWYQLSFYLVGRLMKRHLSALCSLWWCSASTLQMEGSQKMAATLMHISSVGEI